MKLNMHSLLRDKNVLYVTLFITIINMFAYLMFRQFDAVLFFVIIGLITSYFSKNMIIILLTAILSTNLAISIKLIGKVKEGMENKDANKDANAKPKDAKPKDAKNKDKDANAKPKVAMNNKKDANAKNKKKEGMESQANDDSAGEKEPKCVGSDCNKKKKDGFTQQLNPAPIDGMDEDDDDFTSHPTVDYASTLESAYDNLDKLLSSDAINSMSEDTHRLAEKQQMLMGNINKLQPMMEKAGSMLESLNMDKMTGMLGGLQEKLKGMKTTF
jgi:hypothetical protein